MLLETTLGESKKQFKTSASNGFSCCKKGISLTEKKTDLDLDLDLSVFQGSRWEGAVAIYPRYRGQKKTDRQTDRVRVRVSVFH